MKAKVLISYYLGEEGHKAHRIYLEKDYEQAEKDLELVNDGSSSKEWHLQECDIYGS